VEGIVFGGSSNSLVARFAEAMSREFEMSMMGEVQFFSGYESSNQRKEHLCTKLSTPRTLYGSSRWRNPRLRRRLWVRLQLLMRMRKVNMWTRRSTGAWSRHSFTWRRRGRTSNSRYSVRSFSSVSKDFASASGQVHIQVLSSHSRLRPLVLRVLFFGASWFFRRGFCRVSVG
jgi:hypothetical protein